MSYHFIVTNEGKGIINKNKFKRVVKTLAGQAMQALQQNAKHFNSSQYLFNLI